jgi:peroxiredoxin
MKSRLLILALACSFGFAVSAFAQAPKSNKGGDASKSGEKKAPAPKTPADLAYDAFNKVRTQQGGKMDQARFQSVISAGLAYLMEFPTHGRVNDAIRDLAFFGRNIDAKQPALRTSYSSLLKLDVTNARFKEGIADPVKLVLAALDAAVADNDAREASTADNVTTLRDKIDALAELPGSARFQVERERSYSHILMLGANPARAEAHLRKLLEHKDKAIVTMAREELNVVEAKKAPYELKFTALDGKPVNMAELRGKVVAMYFWSSASKPSTDRFESLKQIYSTYRKKNFEVVTVSFDKDEDRPKLEKFIKENRIAWPVYFDGKGPKNEFSPQINATGVPRLYIFDQKGILQTTLAGSPVARVTPDFPQNQLEGKVKQLLGIK